MFKFDNPHRNIYKRTKREHMARGEPAGVAPPCHLRIFPASPVSSSCLRDKIFFCNHSLCSHSRKTSATEKMMTKSHLIHSISQFIDPLRLPLLHKPRNHAGAPAFVCNSHAKAHASSSSGGDAVFPGQRLEKKGRRGQRPPRRLITISTSDGRWHGQWSCDYVFSLRELGVADVAGEGQADADVLVRLFIQKHAGFGFSVEGTITTCFSRRCSSCFSSYSKEINTTLDVWVLPSGRSDPLQLPEVGGNDPSVIYVKPGSEADLDSLIRDAIHLAASAKTDTCSETCGKYTPKWNYIDGKSTYDRRWYRLLEIRNAYKDMPSG